MLNRGWKAGGFCAGGEGTGTRTKALSLPPPGQHRDIEAGALAFTGELFLTILEKKCSSMD